MRARATIATAAAAVLLLAACGDPADGPGPADTDDGTATGTQPASDGEVAWTHHGEVEATLDGRAAAEALEDPDTLADAWATHGFDGDPPTVDFDDEVVLLLGRPDNACPDQPVELAVDDAGHLDIEWVTPPGGCTDPLILWLHALTVHRGVLAEEVTYGPDEPFEGELEAVTLELPPYDGDAPPPPTLEDLDQEAMTDEEIDAVFADHPVERCGPEHEPFRDDTVDGDLSDDPQVADAQRDRAGFGVPSDEASTRAAMEADDAADQDVDDDGLVDGEEPLGAYGFPLTEAELQASQDAEALAADARELLDDEGIDTRFDAIPVIDRADEVRAVVATDQARVDEVQQLLDASFGEGAVAVEVLPWPPRDVADAQDALMELMGGADEGPGAITGMGGPPGPVQLSMVDPTVDALDAIADQVDPALVCVDVQRSGVGPETLDVAPDDAG